MVLSVLLLAAIVYFLPNVTLSSNFGTRAELTLLVDEYAAASNEFDLKANSLIQKRQSTDAVELLELQNRFISLHSATDAFITESHLYSYSLTFLPKIKNHEKSVDLLLEINQALIAEEAIGEPFESFSTCIKKINYAKTASLVLNELNACTHYLTEAKKSLLSLPSQINTHCENGKTPGDIIDVYTQNHTLLLQFYTLSKDQKAKDAAAIDLQYKASLATLQKLPSWNYCISVYLQDASKNFRF
jgi:hypothetical protein